MKNHKSFYLSLIALIFMVLTFTISWWFIIAAAIFSALGWKALLNK